MRCPPIGSTFEEDKELKNFNHQVPTPEFQMQNPGCTPGEEGVDHRIWVPCKIRGASPAIQMSFGMPLSDLLNSEGRYAKLLDVHAAHPFAYKFFQKAVKRLPALQEVFFGKEIKSPSRTMAAGVVIFYMALLHRYWGVAGGIVAAPDSPENPIPNHWDDSVFKNTPGFLPKVTAFQLLGKSGAEQLLASFQQEPVSFC